MQQLKTVAITLFIVITTCSQLDSSNVKPSNSLNSSGPVIIDGVPVPVPSPTEVNLPADNVTTINSNNTTTEKPTSTTATPPTTVTTTSASTTTTTTAATTITTTTKGTTTSASTTTALPSPVTTTVKPTAAPPTTPIPSHRRFDGPSFIGGIVLALGLVAIGFVAFKFYKARTELNYHTL